MFLDIKPVLGHKVTVYTYENVDPLITDILRKITMLIFYYKSLEERYDYSSMNLLSEEITYDGDFPMMLVGGMHGFTLIQDLKIKILKTKNHSFITSDNPIVLYNLSMVKDTEFNRTGFQAPGLMIFVPINEKLCLLFYDSNVYKIQEKDKISFNDT